MSDYNFLMESRLSPEQYKVLTLVSRVAAEQGLNAYLVGGAVRDLTHGQQVVRDLDFAVEGNPQKVLRRLESPVSPGPHGELARSSLSETAFPEVDYESFDSRRISADLRFSNGVQAELGMCRQEVYSKPGLPAEVHLATIFDDLKRRDFSVNAMAVSLHPNSRGLLLDPTNGAADIERQELRALYSRSFQEDPVRIYRILRLGLRLAFKPEERTKIWLDTALQNRVWEHLEPDQQGRELRAILHEDHPERVLRMLAQQKLLIGLDKKLASVRLPYDRYSKIRSVVQSVPGADAFLLNFHFLVEKLGGEHRVRLAKKIIGDSKVIHLVLNLDRSAKNLARVLGSTKASLPSQVYALLSNQPLPVLLYLLTDSFGAKVQKRVKNYLLKYRPMRANLPRAELQALAVKPGAEFEKILERVFVEQLDGKIKNHQQLVKRMRELAGIKEPPPKPAVHKAATARAGAAHSEKEVRKLAHAAAPTKHLEAAAVKPAPRHPKSRLTLKKAKKK
jgi:tRNA nucleotidyltransferase (CCA-adding enzyme)